MSQILAMRVPQARVVDELVGDEQHLVRLPAMADDAAGRDAVDEDVGAVRRRAGRPRAGQDAAAPEPQEQPRLPARLLVVRPVELHQQALDLLVEVGRLGVQRLHLRVGERLGVAIRAGEDRVQPIERGAGGGVARVRGERLLEQLTGARGVAPVARVEPAGVARPGIEGLRRVGAQLGLLVAAELEVQGVDERIDQLLLQREELLLLPLGALARHHLARLHLEHPRVDAQDAPGERVAAGHDVLRREALPQLERGLGIDELALAQPELVEHLVELVALDDAERVDDRQIGDEHIGEPLGEGVERGVSGVVVEVGPSR